jgi:hypothetical protein
MPGVRDVGRRHSFELAAIKQQTNG